MKPIRIFQRIMKKVKIVAVLSVIGIALNIAAESPSKLPKTEILGKEYYIYEAKKGESVYGIAKKFGWDIEEFIRLNPEASGGIQKGDRLFYPTGQVTVVTEVPEPVVIDVTSFEPIKHKVKKGETVYSISRQYGVPLDIIYKSNPSTKKGVKAGEILEIPQTGSSQYYFYSIKKGDTLSSISQTYNTSVEDILKNNAGLTATNLKDGETIRITINSNVGKIRTELVEEDVVSSISSYKVSKNESWEDIAEKTGVEVDVLKDANEELESPQKNDIVNIPVVETVEVEKTIPVDNQIDLTYEEVQEIYDSIRGGTPEERIIEGVRIALLLDEPNSKKDIDFTRGMLVALSEFKDVSYKIDLKVLDGRVSTDNLINDLDNFEPNLIVTTADKAFPLFLADYGNTNNIQIVNVFDLKNDLYEDNASMIQFLPPSSFFNDRIATRIYRDNLRRKLISVGEHDENDGIASELFKLFDNDVENLSLEEFGSMEPDIFQPVLIYSHASKKEEVSDFLTNIDTMVENYPGFDFRIIGRSNWIAMIDDFGDKFQEYRIYVPSRVWLDTNSNVWKQFEEDYDELFEGYPIRSIPNFAASGYDVAKFFIPSIESNKGDFNNIISTAETAGLQNDISLSRVNNWGGFINGIGYLIRFGHDGLNEKIVVK